MGLTDWRDNEYGVGDTILYATSSSGSVTMHEGTVLNIYEKEKYTWRTESEKETLVKVQPTKQAGAYSTSTTAWRDEPFKPVTLRVLNRITFLERGE